MILQLAYHKNVIILFKTWKRDGFFCVRVCKWHHASFLVLVLSYYFQSNKKKTQLNQMKMSLYRPFNYYHN